jgi:hypothetical protein
VGGSGLNGSGSGAVAGGEQGLAHTGGLPLAPAGAVLAVIAALGLALRRAVRRAG